jgi:hypothetical protein
MVVHAVDMPCNVDCSNHTAIKGFPGGRGWTDKQERVAVGARDVLVAGLVVWLADCNLNLPWSRSEQQSGMLTSLPTLLVIAASFIVPSTRAAGRSGYWARGPRCTRPGAGGSFGGG